MRRKIRVLITGAGSPAAPGILKSLERCRDFRVRTTAIDCRPDAVGLHLADEDFVGPPASDPAFIPFVTELCARRGIDVLVSLVTAELVPLARERERLANAGTALLASDPDSLRDIIRKDRLYGRLGREGIAVPDYRVVRTGDALEQAIRELGYPDRAVCFKPAVSDGSRGFHILDPRADRFRLLMEGKPESAHLSLDELRRIVRGRSFPELLVMEYLPNEEFSVDVLANRGNALVAVPRLRLRTVGGITTQGLIRDEPDIAAYAVQAVRQLKLHGNVGIQVRRDAGGRPKLIEINPRMQGTIVHATAAGVNLPALSVKLALGMPIRLEELNIRWGVRMTRYWEEVYEYGDGSAFTL